MNAKEFIKPTKQKIYSYIILIIGLNILPAIVKLFFTVFVARMLGPVKYADFLIFKSTNIPYILTITVTYFVWLYLIISIIVNINKKNAL
ncbi:hypothetical protein HNV12_26365 [Methanococcoides sp. SA1]|nr:hypothetical protein [Methanococcoides sp. SA1]